VPKVLKVEMDIKKFKNIIMICNKGLFKTVSVAIFMVIIFTAINLRAQNDNLQNQEMQNFDSYKDVGYDQVLRPQFHFACKRD
jgi:hypothetical protein